MARTLICLVKGLQQQRMDVLVGNEGMEIHFFPNGPYKEKGLVVWKIAEFPRNFVQAAHDAYKFHFDKERKSFPFEESKVGLKGEFILTNERPEDRTITLSIDGKIGEQPLVFSLEFTVFELPNLIHNLTDYWEEKINW